MNNNKSKYRRREKSSETQVFSMRLPIYLLEWLKWWARHEAVRLDRDYTYTDLIRDILEIKIEQMKEEAQAKEKASIKEPANAG